MSIGSKEKDIYPSNKDFKALYDECNLDTLLSYEIFKLAMTGFEKISELQKDDIITIIDFSKPSVQERLFVIDLNNKIVIYKSLVAHGKNSGENSATSFSNESKSLKSCLGFLLTAETYYGKHGYSLRLDGLEPDINNNARSRAIVIHGADYVSSDFAKQHGRLGRSWGCPALPVTTAKAIIDKISNGSCVFIYGDNPDYIKSSKILNEQ
ncbi:MAG: murein L,D-transpeptidase catalytic domain family protein [Bacteroidales bacterium]|nr:murein L,D-transpeptidase catalytic domain family protein [Bacteroidales bacterium]